MQLIEGSARSRDRHTAGPIRPGLDVAVLALASHTGLPEIHLSVRGGTAPVRLYVYVDGDLHDSRTSTLERCRLDLGGLEAGRHAVTARAVDVTGRWGGASIMVAVPSPAELSDA